MAKRPQHWLLKTEPGEFSIHDLAASPNRTTCWDGVRNYQARNFMRDEMACGDRVLIYHSNAKPPAVAGTATVVKEAYPDPTCWDPNHHHYDPKSSAAAPRWCMVDIQLDQLFAEPVPLPLLRDTPALAKMELLRKGSRLSVQKVRAPEFATILRLAAKLAPEKG